MKFLRDCVEVLLGKVGLIALKMLIGVLTARVLGPSGKGELVMLLLIPGLIATFGNLSIGDALTYGIGSGRVARHEVLGIAMTGVFVIGGLGIVAALYSLPLLLERLFVSAEPTIVLLSIFLIPLLLCDNFVGYLLRAAQNFRLYNLVTVGSRVLLVGALFLVLLVLDLGLSGAVWTYIGYYLLMAVLGLVLIAHLYGYSARLRWQSYKNVLSFGGRAHFATVLGEFENRFDVLLVGYFLAPGQVGIYSVGLALTQLLWYVANSVNNVLFPKIANASSIARQNLWAGQVNRLMLLLASAFMATLAIFGWPLIVLLYGTEFSAAYAVVLVLMPGIVFDCSRRVMMSYFKGVGKPALISRISVVTMILNVSLNLMLIPAVGLLGAALASTVTYSLGAFALLVRFSKTTGLPLRKALIVQRSDMETFRDLIGVIVGKIPLIGSSVFSSSSKH